MYQHTKYAIFERLFHTFPKYQVKQFSPIFQNIDTSIAAVIIY